MNSKSRIRRQLILQRKQLSPRTRLQKSQLITIHLLASSIWQEAHSLGCYLTHRAEVDTSLLIKHCWQQHKHCFLPATQAAKIMYFLPYTQTTSLEQNDYGISQPIWQAELSKPVEQLDLILMPIVAFDKSGTRLGSGAGYYDRILAFKQQQLLTKPLLLGLAYDFQQVPSLTKEPWDIGLDGIITESGLRLFKLTGGI